MATLSVVLTNYNYARYITRAIEATVGQSRRPDQYVIVDDGSTDNSVEIIEPFAAKHGFIRFIRLPKNQGFFKAWQSGVEAATGDYLYGAAADDYILPGFFADAMALAERHPRAGVVFGQMVVVTPEDREIVTLAPSRWRENLFAEPERFLSECLERERAWYTPSGATIYRRDALDEVGGMRPEMLAWCDNFAIRAIGLKHGVAYLNRPCMRYTGHNASMSAPMMLDPAKMLPLIERAAALMRSPEFRGLFPERHVALWEILARAEMGAMDPWLASQLVRRDLTEIRDAYLGLARRGSIIDRTAASLIRTLVALADAAGLRKPGKPG